MHIKETISGFARSQMVRTMFVVMFSLWAPLASLAQHDSMIKISVPPATQIMADGTVAVTIHLSAPAQASTLVVMAGDKNITDYFGSDRCSKAPCDTTARLNGNVIRPGWNYIHAVVEGPNASADSDGAQFFNDHGVDVLDATTGYAPSFAVHIHATQANGLEVDYAPGVGNIPTYYPNAEYKTCRFGKLTLLTLDRGTLAPKSLTCYATTDNATLNSYLKTLTKNDLVFASSSRTEELGKLNLAPIGGTDFTAAKAPTAYGYSVVGYGASPAGLAVESYNTNSTQDWHGIDGDLINIGSTAPMYGFRSSDAPAFAVQPAKAGGTAKITIGYVTSLPIGEGEPPANFALPSQFTNVVYKSPACKVTCEGSFYTAVFDAYTLKLVVSDNYATNSASSDAEMARMVRDLKANLVNVAEPRFVIIASIGDPLGRTNPVYTSTITPSVEIIPFLQSLNVSGNVIKQLIAGGTFSMIGVPGAEPVAGQGNHNITKWYSTSQSGESGAIHGMLMRNNVFRYMPESVAPYTVDSSDPDPTATELLSFATPEQIGTASSVQWPAMDTEGRRNAYAYASDQMNREDFYGGNECRLPKVQCEDIRLRYTSNQLNGISGGIDPRTISFPSKENPGFTEADLTAVKNQLSMEKQYLKNTSNYALALKEINTNALQNIGLSVQNAATSVAQSIDVMTNKPKDSQMSLMPGILDTAAALSGAVGAVNPPAAVVSKLLTAASLVMGMVNSQNQPEPQVSKLGDLLVQNGGVASQYAFRFNNSVQSSTGMFFNDVYSDWFKLQAVGLMTVTPNSGWYYGTVGNSLTEYNNGFVAEARISFFEQVLPQYLTEATVTRHPTYYDKTVGHYDQHAIDLYAMQVTGYTRENLYSTYSFGYWPTPQYPKCTDYVFMVIKNKKDTFPNALGETLMGPANFSDPNGSLGIAREFFYDVSGYPVTGRYASTPWSPFCKK